MHWYASPKVATKPYMVLEGPVSFQCLSLGPPSYSVSFTSLRQMPLGYVNMAAPDSSDIKVNKQALDIALYFAQDATIHIL